MTGHDIGFNLHTMTSNEEFPLTDLSIVKRNFHSIKITRIIEVRMRRILINDNDYHRKSSRDNATINNYRKNAYFCYFNQAFLIRIELIKFQNINCFFNL